jgi:hypothetical protein
MPPNAFKTAPLVVLNGFQGGGQHLQLAASLVQAMFPAISVTTVKLSACQVRAALAGAGQAAVHVCLGRRLRNRR